MILVQIAEKGLVVKHRLHKVISRSGALYTPPYVSGGGGLSIRSASMHTPVACLQLLNLLLYY